MDSAMLKNGEIGFLDFVSGVQKEYVKHYNKKPLNISDWNSGNEFSEEIVKCIPLDNGSHYNSYIYQEGSESAELLANRLGVCNNIFPFISENGTSSIYLISLRLKQIGIHTCYLASPFYFSIKRCLTELGIEVKIINFDIVNLGGFDSKGNPSENSALWVTNPIYSCGINAKDAILDISSSFSRNGGVVIADLTLSDPFDSLVSQISTLNRFYIILAPMKYIGLNSVKFSMILSNKTEYNAFSDISDHVSGGLSRSCWQAYNIFCSAIYDNAKSIFERNIMISRSDVNHIIGDHDLVDTGNGDYGMFRMVFFRNIPYSYGTDVSFLSDACLHSGSSFIPGHLLNVYEKNFCIRLNLSLNSPKFRNSLLRVINYINHQK